MAVNYIPSIRKKVCGDVETRGGYGQDSAIAAVSTNQ